MSDLTERLRHIHMELTVDDYDDVITAAADALEAAEPKLAAIDALLADVRSGDRYHLPLVIDEIDRILHPEEGQ